MNKASSSETRRLQWITFEDPQGLAHGLAASVAATLRGAVERRGRAVLAVSGGSTPAPFFDCLAQQELPWSKVTIVLVDERWSVDPADRNETLVREHLLVGPAAAARFVSAYSGDAYCGDSCGDVDCGDLELEDALALLREGEFGASGSSAELFQPVFDVTLLGMGTDGHTASLFPGAAGIEEALQASGTVSWVSVDPPDAPHARLSMTLPAIVGSRRVILHITGDEKRVVLESALRGRIEERPPVGRVVQACPHLEVWWAPG